MATQVKFTVARGAQTDPAKFTVAAGSAEAQSDTMSLNIDIDKLSKGEALVMIEALEYFINGLKNWPPL